MRTSTKWLLAWLLIPAVVLDWAQFIGGGWEVGEFRDDGLRIVLTKVREL